MASKKSPKITKKLKANLKSPKRLKSPNQNIKKNFTNLEIDDFLNTFTFNETTIRYGNLFRGLEKYGDKNTFISLDRQFQIRYFTLNSKSYIKMTDKNFDIIWPGDLWERMKKELDKLPFYPINDLSGIIKL